MVKKQKEIIRQKPLDKIIDILLKKPRPGEGSRGIMLNEFLPEDLRKHVQVDLGYRMNDKDRCPHGYLEIKVTKKLGRLAFERFIDIDKIKRKYSRLNQENEIIMSDLFYSCECVSQINFEGLVLDLGFPKILKVYPGTLEEFIEKLSERDQKIVGELLSNTYKEYDPKVYLPTIDIPNNVNEDDYPKFLEQELERIRSGVIYESKILFTEHDKNTKPKYFRIKRRPKLESGEYPNYEIDRSSENWIVLQMGQFIDKEKIRIFKADFKQGLPRGIILYYNNELPGESYREIAKEYASTLIKTLKIFENNL
ncbi:hypothetical protein CEE44_05275 [Candidatus Woesearchaeota archaeon B3_Woes]|nr:MAG: hypothetical protein CEE44_05275 [Candidatus Woesearchaeota archaeon B3_Woes]